jgi:6-phosphogluconolactonase (cycloisomerase 2 family)
MRSLSALVSCFLVSTVPLAGCGGGSGSNSNSTSPPPPPPAYTANAKYAYVVTGSYIDEFSVSTSGQWTQIGKAIGAGAIGGTAIAIDPKYRFLYSIGGGYASSEITMFTIDPATGILTPTSPASITIAGLLSQSIAVDGLGRFVYTADTDTNTVTSLAIDQTTGMLTPTSAPITASVMATNGVIADAVGKYVYVEGEYGGLASYSIDQTTGNLNVVSDYPFMGGGGGFPGIINPAGTYYYAAGGQSSAISVVGLNSQTGVLTQVPSGGIIQTGQDATSVALTPDDKYAYITARSDGNLWTFTVDPTSGLLTRLGGLVTAGADYPYQIVVDPGGQLLYVACLGGSVMNFGIKTDGTLTPVGSVTTDGSAEGIVLIPR